MVAAEEMSEDPTSRGCFITTERHFHTEGISGLTTCFALLPAGFGTSLVKQYGGFWLATVQSRAANLTCHTNRKP